MTEYKAQGLKLEVTFDCPLCERRSKSRVRLTLGGLESMTVFCEHCDAAVKVKAP